MENSIVGSARCVGEQNDLAVVRDGARCLVQPINMVRIPRIFKPGRLLNINKFVNNAI